MCAQCAYALRLTESGKVNLNKNLALRRRLHVVVGWHADMPEGLSALPFRFMAS